MPITQIIILVVLLVFSALFSGIETALMSINMIKAKALLQQEKKGSIALNRIKNKPHKLIITILIGNNLVNIGAASLATVIFTDAFGSAGVGIATGVMTFLILIFGEITPKTYATQNAERISLMVARPIEVLSFILAPFVKVFALISKGMSKLLGSKKEDNLSEEELKTIVTMGAEEGILDKEAAQMMHNVLEFKETKVAEIMTPDIDVEMISGDKTLKEVIDFIVKSPYSRYPVYKSNKDKIIGVLDVDDVLGHVKNDEFDIKIKDLVKDAFFVPESKEVDDLLFEFENKQVPMAIVVDEYGHVAGIVTVEDILEEIVGNIFDKSKDDNVYIDRIDAKEAKVDAKISIEEINKALHLGIKEGGFNTLAGFIEHKLQRIPKKGEKIRLKKITLIIEEADDQRVKSVKVIRS